MFSRHQASDHRQRAEIVGGGSKLDAVGHTVRDYFVRDSTDPLQQAPLSAPQIPLIVGSEASLT